MRLQRIIFSLSVLILALGIVVPALAQGTSTISGKVVFGGNREPLGGVAVKIVGINRTVVTGDDGMGRGDHVHGFLLRSMGLSA